MSITRRKVLGSGAGLGAVVVAGGTILSSAGPAYAGAVEDLIAEFTGGAAVGSGGISLGAPQIAENGNTVPVSVSSDGAVSEVMVIATKNPSPGVVRFKFSAMSGSSTASTRIRLAKTQDVIAVAKMGDGSFVSDTKTVKVTIGGCGG
jgi:sulfur-oxidizing protein SoxY